ncbi:MULTISPECIES: nitroreductase/quinone reductase family protein [Saccharothrix]|uniref:Cation-binding protein n=1 Tax=Saccharothrix yanglingensis TaxID=659496 RepID=A0ABU0WWW5_9PSEU|nr:MULTISPECIES: nitroreductase/quinone reductase family protein [Saccharothrix]MDQ2584356.1 cation-binding protein [Saccharothrix yanglingensis]MDU0290539.1 nitroreductase/quinone reductase family protein [Saccharothrix longispora]
MDFNQQVIDEFRANGGRVGGPFEGGRLVLLTTTGARTGARHTTPVGYLPDGDRILVIASAGGSPRHPDWFRNLRANPVVQVEDGVFTYDAKATVLEGAERDAVWARAVEADPGWARYQEQTSRVIPVVALEQVAGGPPNASSMGEALKLLHDAFRRELRTIRREVAESGGTLGAQLKVNCLTACQGLRFHHTSEDNGVFPALEQRFPELDPVLARLREEHVHLAALLAELQATLERGDVATLRRDVDRLVTDLEAHLDYEEEQLVPLLDV